MTDNGITNYGRADVHRDLLMRKADVEEAKETLARRIAYLERVENALTCEHDLEPAGGYIYIQTKCRKCGYIWTD